MTLFDAAVEALRERILSGEYAPGTALTAAELATELGMSRTPIRDALRALANEGLVDMEVNRVARVSDWSADKIRGVFEIRIRLESLGSRAAAENITDEEIDELEQIALEIKQYGDPGPNQDLQRVQTLNSEFHSRITAIAKNPALTHAMGGVIHAALLSRTRAAYTDDEQRRSSMHHLELVAAFRARSPEWAESVMRSHLLQGQLAVLRGQSE